MKYKECRESAYPIQQICAECAGSREHLIFRPLFKWQICSAQRLVGENTLNFLRLIWTWKVGKAVCWRWWLSTAKKGLTVAPTSRRSLLPDMNELSIFLKIKWNWKICILFCWQNWGLICSICTHRGMTTTSRSTWNSAPQNVYRKDIESDMSPSNGRAACLLSPASGVRTVRGRALSLPIIFWSFCHVLKSKFCSWG